MGSNNLILLIDLFFCSPKSQPMVNLWLVLLVWHCGSENESGGNRECTECTIDSSFSQSSLGWIRIVANFAPLIWYPPDLDPNLRLVSLCKNSSNQERYILKDISGLQVWSVWNNHLTDGTSKNCVWSFWFRQTRCYRKQIRGPARLQDQNIHRTGLLDSKCHMPIGWL